MVTTFINIEGNIGAGKTTFLQELESKLSQFFTVKVVPEFVYENEANVLLNAMYEKRIDSFDFQKYLFNTRTNFIYKIGKSEEKPDFILLDRNIDIQYHIFGSVLLKKGRLSKKEYKQMKRMLNTYEAILNNLFPNRSECMIYLDCSEENCLKRIKTRNREGENKIDKDYLSLLEEEHKKYLNNPDVINKYWAIKEINNNEEWENEKNVKETIRWLFI